MNSFDKDSIIISQICGSISPGKKKLQKLMYLIYRKGVDLNLNFSIHFFGPYSAKLDEIVHILESYDKLSIDTSGPTHIIHIGSVPIDGKLNEEDQKKTDDVLSAFSNRSAFDLEAITTMDYVANRLLSGCKDEEIIKDKVKKIKGSKFSDENLSDSYSTLKHFRFI